MHLEDRLFSIKNLYKNNSNQLMITSSNQGPIKILITQEDTWLQQGIILEIKMLNFKLLHMPTLYHKINIIMEVYGIHLRGILET